MGNNTAYSAFEATVIACYNEGVLTKKLLTTLGRAYEGMDVDSGGEAGTLSKSIPGPDGVRRKLSLREIVVQVSTGKAPEAAPKHPSYSKWDSWSDEQRDAVEKWQERMDEAFDKATRPFKWG